MEITVKQTVNVPCSPWCGNCYRKEKDAKGRDFCTIYNRFLYLRKGRFLKCQECYIALYDEIERADNG